MGLARRCTVDALTCLGHIQEVFRRHFGVPADFAYESMKKVCKIRGYMKTLRHPLPAYLRELSVVPTPFSS